MKQMRYKILGYSGVWNPETREVEQKECLAEIKCPYTEAAYQDALSKAYNSKVTVEEVPDPEPSNPSRDEQIAQLQKQLAEQQAVLNALLGVE